MIEVESKFRISSPDKYRKLASSIANYIGKHPKVDDYYTLESLDHYPKKSLRVRKRDGFHEVNFKHKLSFIDGVYSKGEFEFRLQDADRFLTLIREFGFRKWLRKEKITYLYEINKNFHIEVNNVKGLGWFIEVEYLADKKDADKARKEVVRVSELLGFKKWDAVKEGYTKMLWNKII